MQVQFFILNQIWIMSKHNFKEPINLLWKSVSLTEVSLISRQHISLTLHSLAKFESKQLVRAIETLNNALVSDVTSHYTLHRDSPSDSLYELTPYLNACGLTQPSLQVYSTFKVGGERVVHCVY